MNDVATLELPYDPTLLKQMIVQIKREAAETIEAMQLRHQVEMDAVLRRFYGPKSEKFDPRQLLILFAVNVRAPYFLVQQLLPVLGDGSNVIFVSSLGARSAVGTLAAYAATKGAVDTLVKQFAAALGPRGIRVNSVAPGVVDTEMSNFAHTESGRQLTLSMQALKRIATPADIGGVFAFLASDAARWITGQTIAVDGGSKL